MGRSLVRFRPGPPLTAEVYTKPRPKFIPLFGSEPCRRRERPRGSLPSHHRAAVRHFAARFRRYYAILKSNSCSIVGRSTHLTPKRLHTVGIRIFFLRLLDSCVTTAPS